MVVIVTGAGISKKSGLDTFEELELRGIDMRKVLDREYANNNWEKFSKEYIQFAETINNAEPNSNHFIIEKLKEMFPKKVVIGTMNVDSLHQKANTEVFELHGNCKHANPEIDSIVLYRDTLPEQYSKFIDVITNVYEERILFCVIGSSMQTSTIQMIQEEINMLHYFKSCEISMITIREDLTEDFIEMCKRYI